MKALGITLFVCALVSAGEMPQVEGEVVSTAGAGQGPLWAQLDSLNGGDVARSQVGLDGRFFFIATPSGTYMLRIMDTMGRELTSQRVNVGNENRRVTIELPETTAAPPQRLGSPVAA
jgi:hypothetical protein